jgi:hypothetical protein
VGQVAQLGPGGVQLLTQAGERRGRRGGVAPALVLRQAQAEAEGDEPLLGPVVQVALDLAADAVGGLDETDP